MYRRTIMSLAGGGIGAVAYGGTVTGAQETDPALFQVTATGTNAPVGGGESLTVRALIENVGDETGTTDIELIVGHDPQVEDSRLLTLGPGTSATVTLTFQAGEPSGESETFPVRVDTGAHTITEVVTVDDAGPALFEVTDRWTNSPVGGGDVLTVNATITNTGGETGTTDIELIVGHDPQLEDSQQLTLGPGEQATITLTFQAGQPTGGSEQFPVQVDTGAHAVSEEVLVT